ncbi:MAG TPA: 1-phosphofructokinase [Clostridiaceae bacterium]
MVITVTLNPAMDKTVYTDDFHIGRVNRIRSERYDIGGKGINVSKTLKNMGVQSTCTGFLGGRRENTFISELATRDIKADFIHISGATRTNTKIIDLINTTSSDLNEAGPTVNSWELEWYMDHFDKICHNKDIVVFSGGTPEGVPVDIYYQLIIKAKKLGAFTVLDTEGDLLAEGIKAKPDMIKPNQFEFSKLVGKDFNNIDSIAQAGYDLSCSGISKIMISLGEKGAIFVFDGKVYYSEAIKVPVKSPVGAGDAMVAGGIYSYINGYTDKEFIDFSMASAAAAVASEGNEASISDIKELLNKTKINVMEGFVDGCSRD